MAKPFQFLDPIKIMRLHNFYQYFFSLGLFLFYSCDTKPYSTSIIEEEMTGVNESKVSFHLLIDENTSLFNFLNAQAIPSEDSKYLIFNENLNSIDQYSLHSGQMDKRVIFPKEGPNSLPLMQIPYGFHYVNSDTLIFFSGLLETLYLANLEGEIYKELELSGNAVGFGSVGPRSAIAYKDGKVYMQTLPRIPINIPQNYQAPPSGIAKINLVTGDYEELQLPYPKEYENKNIAQQLKMIDLVYNTKSERFIINFPLAHELLITDFKSTFDWIPVKSTLVNKVLETDRSNAIVEASKLNNMYYWMNSGYEKIIYDPANDMYIREARSGISDEAYLNRKLTSQRELLVLNSNFDVIKKEKYESAEMFYHFFLDDSFYWNKDINTYNIDTGVEDTLYFHQVKVIEN
ncbi:hypothetical protein [Algoriphagus namhaensis]